MIAPTAVRRVLLVVDSLQPGGAERHVTDLALALARRHCEVAVACAVGGEFSGALADGGVAVHALVGVLVKRRTSVRYASALRHLLASRRFDLVHAHVHASEVAAAVATRGSGVPLVLTEHTEAPWRRRADRRAAAGAFAEARRVVAVSRAVQRALVSDYGVAPSRIVLVHPAVGPPTALVREPVDLPPGDGPLVGFTGRLVHSKGVDLLLHAAALLPAPPRLLVVGDGPERPVLERLVEALGLRRQVRFTGFRRDARHLLDRVDLLVVPSRSDGTPLAVSEALLAGVPVIAARLGGIPEQITDGREGLLVPPADPPALAAAIARLLADPSLRRRMGATGRRRAAGRSHEHMVDTLQRVYAAASADRAVPEAVS